MARKGKGGEEPKRDPTKVVFLSLNMILLSFFILLTALSQPDRTREAQVAMQVRLAFQTFGGAVLGFGPNIDQSGISREKALEETSLRVEEFLGELTRFVEDNREYKAVSYEITAEGTSIHLSQAFTFDRGSVELNRDVRGLIDSIFTMALRTTNPIRIEGHTDNSPIEAPAIGDNWELSAKRAQAVFRYFTASGQIPAGRFTLVGHAGYRPLVSNLTDAGKARNRRVTITFVGRLQRVDERPEVFR